MLKRELYLLEPSWLSSSVSTLLLGTLANVQFKSLPGLRDIINSFVNVQLDDDPLTPDQPSSGNMLDENMEKKNGGSVKANKKTPTKPSKQSAKSPKQPKINLKKRNQYGEYEIHKACKTGNGEYLVRILATHGVDVNVTDNNKNTALHEAVENNQLECIKTLLNFVPFKTMDSFFPLTPKRGAAATEPVKPKNKYVDVLAMDNDGESPIMYATKYDKPEILRYILEFIKEQEDRNSTHFPALAIVLDSAPGGLEAYCQSDDQRAIVEQFRQQMKPAKEGPAPEAISRDLVLTKKFQILIRNSLHR